MFLLTLFSFLAGIATVLSPCVLPVLPALLSGSFSGGRKRPLGIILGLIVSFTFFTLSLSWLVQSFGFSAVFLRYLAIFIIGIFGMIMILPYVSDEFAKWTASVGELGNYLQNKEGTNGSGFFSGFVLGCALGLIWTPCAGPILAAITTLIATQSITFSIVVLTLAYSLGAGLSLLLIAYGGRHVISSVPFFSKHSTGIRQTFGCIMLLTALALVFNWDVAFQQKVIQLFPNIQIENNAAVEKELNKLRPAPVNFPNTSNLNVSSERDLPKLAAAPNFEGTQWINSPPLNLKALRDKVVLVDFWTYSCINCIRTFPYLIDWNNKYENKGLVIVGVHTPEFEFEKDFKNVKDATERFKITYPVVLDNQYVIWQAYHNSYWPAHYLIDQNGIIRQVHFGEGGYLETENAIRVLLGLAPISKETGITPIVKEERPISPETYLGYLRGQSYVPSNIIEKDKVKDYAFSGKIGDNQVAIQGLWKVEGERIISEANDNILKINFLAGRVYLVLGGTSSEPILVSLDGQSLEEKYYTKDENSLGQLFVKEPRKYDIVNLKEGYQRHILTLKIPKGIEVYAFTFGLHDKM